MSDPSVSSSAHIEPLDGARASSSPERAHQSRSIPSLSPEATSSPATLGRELHEDEEDDDARGDELACQRWEGSPHEEEEEDHDDADADDDEHDDAQRLRISLPGQHASR